MKRKREKFNFRLCAVLVTAFLWILPLLPARAFAQSPPTLDGQLDDVYLSHGHIYDWGGYYENADAKLYVISDTSIDANYIWMVWVINKGFNDNSYNTNIHSSWPGGHSFDDLLESDMQQLRIENSCNEVVVDASMDYIDGPPYHAAYLTPSGYDSDMDSTESIKNSINGGDWTKFAYKTSLVSNLNDFGYCVAGDCSAGGTDLLVDSPPWLDEPNYIPTATYSQWEYSLMWEMRIDRTVFETVTCPGGDTTWPWATPIVLHASPSKSVNHPPLRLLPIDIGDTVWQDIDRDGVQDVGEPGIPNVTMAIYSDPNGDGDYSDGALLLTTVTDAYGKYMFHLLGSRNYVVEVTDDYGMLTGYSPTTGTSNPMGPITPEMGEKYLDADFGYAHTDTTKAVIGDYVWSDADNDGIQDPGEPGIGGVTIDLLEDIDGDGNFTDVVASTSTSDDGYYHFMNVNPGCYKVDVTDTGGVLTGYTLTFGPHSRPDPTDEICLAAGDKFVNADFGYYQAGLGTIGNQVWLETDADGLFEAGEEGISDVTLSLVKDNNGNGIWDPGERVISTITTSDGTYQFVGLPLDDGDGDADYIVTVTDRYNMVQDLTHSIGASLGSNNNSQRDPYAVAVSAASPDNQTADFGYYYKTDLGLVGDTVWYDLDGDYSQDLGEQGIEGVKLELWYQQGSKWVNTDLYTYTDADGHYFFTHLDNGGGGTAYRVVVAADNFTTGPLVGLTATNQPDNMDESDKLTGANPQDLTLDFGYNFGAGTTYEIGDYVWHDIDNDGVQDAFEHGLENVTLALYEDSNGNGTIDAGEPIIATDTTDANGNYLFSGLVDGGNYIVKITDEYHMLTGAVQSYGNEPWPVTISGASNYTIDFGYYWPTLAFISAFRAYSDGGPVVLHWETESELGTAGFYLLRRDGTTGKYAQVNQEFLAGLVHAPQGGIYRFVDPGAAPGATYTYELVEVESSGKTRTFGPFTVTVGAKEIGQPMHGNYSKTPHPMSRAKLARIQARQQELRAARLLEKAIRKGQLKIAVKERGLYYLSAMEIADVMGVPGPAVERMIQGHQLSLVNRGEEAAWLAGNGNSGLYFYGEDIHSIYTDRNVYWLKPGKGLAMEFVNGGMPGPASGAETFKDSLHLEEDHYALTALFDDPKADFWLWDFINAGQEGKSFNFYAPGAADWGTANLAVNLKGASNTAAALDHHVKVRLNGTYIGEDQWDGIDAHQCSLSFDQSLLNDGINTIEVTGLLDSGVSHSIFYVDSFELTFHRHYRAVDDRLLCRAGGNPVITIEGFSNPDIFVFDVTKPREPKLVTGTFIDAANRVSFMPRKPDQVYLALTVNGLHSPLSVTADKPSKLMNRGNSADYLVIAGEGLENAAQDLASLRQGKGLETMVVELEDIYDEFNHGISNPAAIKAFLDYAYHHWGHKGPQYVVLAGDGSYDYKDNLGYGECLVPSILVKTPNGLFAADNQFGDTAGNDCVPEIAVGRLPVMTEAELLTLTDKISDYENAGGQWTNRVIMLADNPDYAGNFPADSDYLASLIPLGYTVDKIYLPDFSTIQQARQAVIDGFNAGAVLANYIGHAGLTQLAHEGLLRSVDVPYLQNGERLPLMAAMTCVAGRFTVPGHDSLSEELVLKDNGGAAAVWAPTGASVNFLARILAEGFFKAVFQAQEKTLGKAVLKALQAYAVSGAESFMLNIYNLLGDPALEIR